VGKKRAVARGTGVGAAPALAAAFPAAADRRLLASALLLILAVASPGHGDSVALLDSELEAAVERARLVLGAERSVDLASFVVGGEPFSLASMALLRDAKRRGVRVRLLLDGQANRLPMAVEAHLLAEGVEIRVYHPFRLRKPEWLSRRMHDKLLIVAWRSRCWKRCQPHAWAMCVDRVESMPLVSGFHGWPPSHSRNDSPAWRHEAESA
jgi:phosphatidylserine/phosphatidylglycerophosphate/cardiolipin synthase-like enzyme